MLVHQMRSHPALKKTGRGASKKVSCASAKEPTFLASNRRHIVALDSKPVQAVRRPFNEFFRREGMPRLSLRAGIAILHRRSKVRWQRQPLVTSHLNLEPNGWSAPRFRGIRSAKRIRA